MNFTLIIPAFREAENLEILLPAVSGLAEEVIVIDPGSDDGTEDLCSKYGVRYVKQMSKGKGRALVEAVEYAKNEVICFFDADLAHNPNDIKKIVRPVLNGDVLHVSGSRMLGGSSELFAEADHMFRLFGSLIINFMISKRFNIKMTDCQNGFRAINKKFFKSLNLNSGHTTIEQEMVGKTLMNGEMILEIPTHEFSRIAGHSKIQILKHGPAYVMSLLKIVTSRKIKPIDQENIKNIRKKYSYNWWDNA
jgi:dolichol-phosphate mannosyltransferase